MNTNKPILPVEPLSFEEPNQPQVARAQDPAPTPGEQAPYADVGTPFLSHPEAANATDQWQRIQAAFVDDPRQSVADAHQLVGELMQRIVDSFSRERDGLERQWASGENVSTEDLRLCLQRYRAFFSRLLPAANERNLH
jgi:hypothetical protein